MEKKAMTAQAAITAEITAVPFAKLTEAEDNVRKTRSETGIESLAASIKAEGLLQNLVVRKIKGGKFEVLAGERRRRAIALLVEAGDMDKNTSVPCQVVAGEGAISLSLAENIHREAMHPVDQFEAWVAMADSGMDIDQIAARHGASPSLILKRLRLGRLSPVVLEALRTDEISLDTASAFCLNEDHAQQERVFEALKASPYQALSAHNVRHAMTKGEIASSDRRARLISPEEYERAGGTIRENLFGDEVYYQDGELLDQLVAEKLDAEVTRVKAELGLAWCELTEKHEYEAIYGMRRVATEKVEMTDEEHAEWTRICDELAAMGTEHENDWSEEDEEKWEELDAQREALEAKQNRYNPEDIAIAGCFVTLNHRGEISVYPPVIRPADDPIAKATKKELAALKGDNGGLSQALLDDLANVRLEIMQAELLKSPELARDLLAFHTLRNAFSNYYVSSPFNLTASPGERRRGKIDGDEIGIFHGREDIAAIIEALPLDWHEIKDEAESFEAFRSLTDEEKTRLQAYAASLMLRPQLSTENNAHPSLEHFASIVETDFSAYWTPNKAFFARTTKPYMLDVAKDVIGADFAKNHESVKKGELAATLGEKVFAQALADEPALEADAAARARAWLPQGMSSAKTDKE